MTLLEFWRVRVVARWLALLALCASSLVTITAPLTPSYALPASANPAAVAADWWDAGWRFRVPITVNANGYARTDKPVEVDLNFTTLLGELGQSGSFDPNSIRVVEVASGGGLIPNIPYQFDRANNYNKNSNASGVLVFLMNGATGANASRTFHLYFELESAGIAAPSYPDQTQVSSVQDEGLESFRIRTDNATYFYQKVAGGFSSLEDVDGNDWLNYHPNPPNSAGSTYRGIPNMVHPEGKLHPGATGHTTTLVHSGPLKESIATTINTDSDDRKWDVLWEFFPTYARMTVRDVDHDYWFLYEGTPGGSFEGNSDFVMRSNGVQNLASQSWTGDLAGEEWVYFADPAEARSLYLVQHEQDNVVDSYRPQSDSGGSMTVFGFGREGTKKRLSATPRHFTIGLVDETTFGPTAATIRNAYRELAVGVGAAQEQGGASQYTLTVSVVGNGSVTVDPQKATYDPGEVVTLTAIPDSGWNFSAWSGSVSGSQNPRTVTMNGNRSVTATFTQGGGGTAITIVKDAIPNANRNFKFKGGFGEFFLDDTNGDDGDAYTNSRTFPVNPGQYTVIEAAATGWTLTDIACSPSGSGAVNLGTRRVVITIGSGQAVTCTFTNQKNTTLRTLSYADQNQAGAPSGDQALAGQLIRVYDSQGTLVSETIANHYGKVSLPNLAPGEYTICSGAASELCQTVTLVSGQITEVQFAHFTAEVNAASAEDAAVGGVAVTVTPEPTDESQEESAPANDDAYLNTPANQSTLFMPLVGAGD
jgi:plastocyanin